MNLNNLLCEQTADLTVLLQDTFTAGTPVKHEQAAAAVAYSFSVSISVSISV